MDRNTFVSAILATLPAGRALANPGGGTSTILNTSTSRIAYRRGNSRITVSLDDLYNAFATFEGRRVTTSELKKYAPRTFDSTESGHNCNGTFLFMALQRIGLAGEIQGEGKRGNPFWIEIADPR